MLIKTLKFLIVPGLSIGLAVLFVYSGTAKILEPRLFLSAVSGYQLFDSRGSDFVASVVPWLEVIFGACILTGPLASSALLGIMALLAMDAAAIGTALYRHLQIGCGCFAFGSEPVVSYITEMRTMAILTAAIFVFIWNYTARSRSTEQQFNLNATPASS